jgi:hypothetical protein
MTRDFQAIIGWPAWKIAATKNERDQGNLTDE